MHKYRVLSVILASISALSAATSQAAMYSATYSCRSLHQETETTFQLDLAGDAGAQNGDPLIFDSALSATNRQAVYTSANGNHIFVDKDLAALNQGQPSVTGNDGYARLDDGTKYICAYLAVNQYETGVAIDNNTTADGYVTLQFNLPPKIKSVNLTAVKIEAPNRIAVNIPNPIVALGPALTIRIPISGGIGDYILDVSTDDSTVASFRVKNTNSVNLKYISGSSLVDPTNPEIVALAQTLIAGFTTDRDKILAIHNWMAKNIVYDFLPNGDANMHTLSTDSISVLHSKVTICFGYAALNAALLRSVGIPTRYLLGVKVNHAWTEVLLNGNWVLDDTTWDAFAYYEVKDGHWHRTGVLNPSTQYRYLGFMPGSATDHPPGYETNL